MTDVTPQQSEPEWEPAPPEPDPALPPPEPTPAPPQEPPEVRRKFFARAMGEILSPFAGIIERKINPFLRALEQLPEEVEQKADQISRTIGAHAPVHLPVAREPERILRPPGALPEDEFTALCSRCGICVGVCPAQAIKLDAQTLVGLGYPYIIARTSPCVVCDSLACMHHCPTGALRPLDKLEINMGLAKVTHGLCRRDHGEDCRVCVEACPLGAAAITISAESGRVRVKQNGCIGCGVCERACPTEPAAIVVIPARPPTEPIVA